MNDGWTHFSGYESPLEDEVTIDVRFDTGKVLEKLYPWDVKWGTSNPGFGYVTAYRVNERVKPQFA